MKKAVLVGVLKSRDDLRLLLEEKWYRIPLAFLPKRRFTHLAFYEPQTAFGEAGKCIRYYARVTKREVRRRVELLPSERTHCRASDRYLKCSFRTIEELEKPIRNIIPRRISFGFTSLRALRSAHDMLELYGVPPTEQIVACELRCLGIPFVAQYRLVLKSPLTRGVPESARAGVVKRYRLDLAILCRRGNIAVECDNRKAHSGKPQKLKDRRKDAALRDCGWRVLRLTEADIIEHLDECISCIRKCILSLGGIPLNKGGDTF